MPATKASNVAPPAPAIASGNKCSNTEASNAAMAKLRSGNSTVGRAAPTNVISTPANTEASVATRLITTAAT
jgi:hypothetical protein